MILDPDDYRFTFSEVVGESSSYAADLRNWMARGILNVGQKHKLGRWLFSMSDIIRINTVSMVTSLTNASLAEANTFSEKIDARYRELFALDADGNPQLLSLLSSDTPEGRRRIYMHSATSPMWATVTKDGKPVLDPLDSGHVIPFEDYFSRSAHIFLPVDEIIASNVMNRVIDSYEEEYGDWEVLPVGKVVPGEPEDSAHWAAQYTIEALIAWHKKLASLKVRSSDKQ